MKLKIWIRGHNKKIKTSRVVILACSSPYWPIISFYRVVLKYSEKLQLPSMNKKKKKKTKQNMDQGT